MKTRKEAVAYARRMLQSGFSQPKSEQIIPVPEKQSWHWGKCEIGALMDFIYEGKPVDVDEEIWHRQNLRNR